MKYKVFFFFALSNVSNHPCCQIHVTVESEDLISAVQTPFIVIIIDSAEVKMTVSHIFTGPVWAVIL